MDKKRENEDEEKKALSVVVQTVDTLFMLSKICRRDS